MANSTDVSLNVILILNKNCFQKSINRANHYELFFSVVQTANLFAE